ncbi:MAG: hypothetical protein IJY22_07935 [Clostridia bacterium]|nr:hypothetical protein [Clostridia bacterium]
MKKKLIALLLAIMMVVAMLPATVISAMDLASVDETPAGEAGTTTGGTTASTESTPVVDDDTEVFEDDRTVVTTEPTKDHYFAVINPNGDVVGYYATLVDADNAVEDGDPIRQLQDYTVTATVRLGNGRNKYQSEANRPAADSELPITYTIDGNGFKIIANLPSGSTGMAIQTTENSDGDKLTFKNLFLISSAGGVGLYAGTGKGMHGVFENCKVYAGASYWYVDPTFYKGSAYDTNGDGKPEYGTIDKLGQGIGLDNSTVNTYMTIKGKDTVVMTYSWEAVKSAGITEIYDGYFHALDGYQTAWEHIGTAGTSGASDHKMLIYGGTFVNEKRACVLVSANAQGYIHGGTFIQTAKDKNTDATCIMSGWNNGGHVYVTGGLFWLNWLATSGNPAPVYVQNTGAAATVLGGDFYYTSLGKPVSGVDGASFKLGTYSELVGEAVNLDTLTVNTLTGEKLITANYHATVECTITPDLVTPEAVAPDKNGNVAEIVIYDKAGNIVTALDADVDNTNGIWSYLRDGAIEYTTYASTLQEWGRSFYLMPEGGTYSLHADLLLGGNSIMCQTMGDVTFTVQGNGHTVDADNAYMDGTTEKHLYFCYAQGGNVTFYNITMKNSSGRGIQLGNNRQHPHTWVLGAGTTVYAQSGSAAYIGSAGTLIVEDGALLKSDDSYKGENNALIQMVGSAAFIMNGGKLEHQGAKSIFDEKGFVKDNQTGDFAELLRVWRIEYNADSKRVRYIYDNATIHLLGGEIETAHGSAHLLRRQDNSTTVDFKVGDVKFSYHEWNPATEKIEKYSFTAKEQDSVSLLDENGDLVCVFDSIEETLPYVKDGYTVKLNTNVVELHPLRLNLKDVSWTLDFNGSSYYYYAGGQALLYVQGENQNLLVKNGNAYSNNNIIEVGSANDIFQDVVFENMGIFSGGTTHVNDVGIGSANSYFWLRGDSTHVTFIGEDTVVRSSRRTTIISEGAMVEIYDGEYTTHAGYGVIETKALGKPATNSNVLTRGQLTIYGGTFISGGYHTQYWDTEDKVWKDSYDGHSRTVIRAMWGSTAYIVDGNFIYRSATNADEGGTNLLRGSAESTNGYIYVLGGNFYNAHETRPIYGGGQPTLAFFRFFGGTFYSVANSEIKSEIVGDKTQGHHTNFTSYYGSFYDEFYTPVSETGEYVFDETSGVHPAAQGVTYNNKYTIAYDNDFITSTWGNTYSGNKALRVSYGYTTSEGVVVDRTRDLHGFELEAAVWSVGNKGAVTLLADTEWNAYKHTTTTTFPTTGDVTAYGLVQKAQHQNFEWTLNSAAPEGEYYTLKGNSKDKYIFFVYGGTMNIENVTLQNISGRVIEMADWYGNRSVVNVQNGGEVSGFSECTFNIPTGGYGELNIRDGGYVNALDINLYPNSGVAGNSTIKHQGHKDKFAVNIYDGGYVNYARDGVTPQSGGLKRGDGKGWIAVRMTNNASLLNVYGGKLYGNYNSQNLETDTNRYATILTWGATGGRGSVINVYGGDIYSECSYCLYNGQIETEVNIYGGYWHNNISAENHDTWKACRVLHSNSGFVNIYGGKFEKENNCGCQCIQLNRWKSGDEDGHYNIFGGEFIGGNDTMAFGDAARVTLGGTHPITGEAIRPTISGPTSAAIGANANADGFLTINDVNIIGNGKQAIYCGDMPIVINGGTFGDAGHRTGVSLNVMHGSSTSDITVNGGTFYPNGHFMALRGNGVRDITLNDAYVDTASAICNWQPNDTYKGNPSRIVFNGGYYTNATTDSGWGIFNDGNANAINTNLTINGGEFYHSGGSRMMKWYGHVTCNINGGYFWSDSTSDLYQAEASAVTYTTISGGEFVNVDPNRDRGAFYMDGGGYLIFREGKDADGNPTVPKITSGGDAVRIYANDISLLVQNAEIEAGGRALYFDTANAGISHVINAGTFKAQGYCLQTHANNTAGVVINGGHFSSVKGNNGPDACISIEGGKCTFNAGIFEANGMCVARVLGGKTGNEFDMNGTVSKVSTAILEINGGVFHLLEASGRNYDYDAVIRCGGGSTYGWVYLNGGTFINDREGSEAVINKNNVHGNLYVNGGIFMTSGNQENYFRTSGNVGGSAYPFDGAVAVNKAEDMTMTYGGKTYYTMILRLADEAAPSTKKGAQVRLLGDNLGIRFVSGIDAETVAKYAAMENVTVTYGTLIAPLDYIVATNGVFTHKALELAGLTGADIVATEKGTVVNADGSLTIRAALTNIKAENRDRALAAIAYVCVENADGTKTYSYGAFNSSDNIRSLSGIATKSLDDVKDMYGAYGTARYIYESIVHEGKYSRYTPEQQKAMMACIPAYDAE